MCVIIVKNNRQKLGLDTAKKSARVNPHGLGVVWLDTYKITYHKSNEYKVIANTTRPFIAHFRYATIGKVGKSNTHPFQCGNKPHEYLMMNGTIKGLGDVNTCDTKVLANNLGDLPRNTWKEHLKQFLCRFVSVNVRNKSFQIYNKQLWVQHNGILFSKANVVEGNYVAVYGTLKKNYSNYWWYLGESTYVGRGKTYSKYPLVIAGLPYLINEKGKGHNVEIDLFKVTDATLSDLDRLEGHPNWYRREQIYVDVNGKKVLAWIYFNIREKSAGREFHKSYKQETKYTKQDYYYDWMGFNSTSKNSTDSCEVSKPDVKPEPAKDTRQTSFYFEDEIFHEEADKEFDVKNEKPMCINCFHDLEWDGFANYFCNGCNDWFNEKEVKKHIVDFNAFSHDNNALPF